MASLATTRFGGLLQRVVGDRLREEADARAHLGEHVLGVVGELHLHDDRGLGAVDALAELGGDAAVSLVRVGIEDDLAGPADLHEVEARLGDVGLDHEAREVDDLGDEADVADAADELADGRGLRDDASADGRDDRCGP